MSRQINSETDLDRALEAPRFLIFKHSLVCPVSDRAFDEYGRFVDANPDVPTAWIDVIGGRPLSRRVEAHTGVRHESPQALLVHGGKVLWHASHGALTVDSLTSAWSLHGG